MIINQLQGKNFSLYHGDCVEVIKNIPDRSIHYSIFSPPFASLYTYSPSEKDMGNSKTDEQFYYHFRFLVKELFRVLANGRLISFHCMNLPTFMGKEGFIGIKDFRGDLIRIFQETGFIYHSEVTIWKDPVIAMQRTKAVGLLHKQLVKDSSMSRQGIPDYLITMRKPGKNEEAIMGGFTKFVGENAPNKLVDLTVEEYNQAWKDYIENQNISKAVTDSINIWQRYASPVWMDIDPSDTLQYQNARDNNDERHIAPLQLQVIERGLQLWTNPADVVLDPFNGIGSTGHVSLKNKRKYIGIELKDTYFECSKKNLLNAEKEAGKKKLF